MGTEGLNGKEEIAVLFERYSRSLIIQIDIMSNKCAGLKKGLCKFQYTPDFFNIFTGEEIINLNQIQRKIPSILDKLNELKKTLGLKDLSIIRLGSPIERLGEITNEVEEIDKFFDSCIAKLPKPKPDPLFWILCPYSSLSSWLKRYFLKISMKIMDKK